MIRITQLLEGTGTVSEVIKYRNTSEVPSRLLAFTDQRRPVVFWNITKRCNLSCTHCYIDAGAPGGNELSREEGQDFLEDLSRMRVPLLMFSGGEPLVHVDFWEYAAFARDRGLKTALSTNGTLITPDVANRLRDLGIEYVGISLDGADAGTHDAIRQQPGSYHRAVQGLRNCIMAGLSTGVRITVTRDNCGEVVRLLDQTREMGVPRFCVYWLVPSGRGGDVYDRQITPAETVRILDALLKKASELHGEGMEILTVDAPQDGIYLLHQMKEMSHPEYNQCLNLLRCRGDSCSAGDRVANVDPYGDVYPCQFMQREELRIGSLRTRKFSDLWNDPENPILIALRHKVNRLKGACGSCIHKELCGGGCRIRAYAQSGDLWAEDPLCSFAIRK